LASTCANGYVRVVLLVLVLVLVLETESIVDTASVDCNRVEILVFTTPAVDGTVPIIGEVQADDCNLWPATRLVVVVAITAGRNAVTALPRNSTSSSMLVMMRMATTTTTASVVVVFAGLMGTTNGKLAAEEKRVQRQAGD
jgi:hypothetical protein